MCLHLKRCSPGKCSQAHKYCFYLFFLGRFCQLQGVGLLHWWYFLRVGIPWWNYGDGNYLFSFLQFKIPQPAPGIVRKVSNLKRKGLYGRVLSLPPYKSFSSWPGTQHKTFFVWICWNLVKWILQLSYRSIFKIVFA